MIQKHIEIKKTTQKNGQIKKQCTEDGFFCANENNHEICFHCAVYAGKEDLPVQFERDEPR